MTERAPLLQYKDVAMQLTLSVRQVKRLKNGKALKHVQMGTRAVRFRQKDVDDFVSRRAGDRTTANI